jgi:membrane protease subunit HflC
MKKILTPIVALLVLTAIMLPQVFYTVDETDLVVITRLGEVVDIKTEPGLSTKTPFVETVNRFDKRLLRIDVPVASMPDRESQFLDIDAYVRYRIVDPKKFLEKLQDEFTASSRLGQIAISEIRAEVGVRDRKDIIGGEPITKPDGSIVVEAKVDENGIPAREAMMALVRVRTTKRVIESDFGVEIVDVRIKRADFPEATEMSIFQRMTTERKVQADRLRAEGEEQYLTITAAVDKQVQGEILAEADRDANMRRGEGEAEAIRILADALAQDEDFFEFRRSLEAYRAFVDDKTTLVLSTNSDLLAYLEGPVKKATVATP